MTVVVAGQDVTDHRIAVLLAGIIYGGADVFLHVQGIGTLRKVCLRVFVEPFLFDAAFLWCAATGYAPRNVQVVVFRCGSHEHQLRAGLGDLLPPVGGSVQDVLFILLFVRAGARCDYKVNVVVIEPFDEVFVVLAAH